MHKGFIVLKNAWLVSCKNWSWWQNVHAIERSPRKVKREYQLLPTRL